MSDSLPDEIADETVYAAENIDEFVQRTRYQQIFDAKQRAAEALREAEFRRLEARQQMSQAEAERAVQRAIRQAVEAYVLECEPLYERTEAGQKLLHDVRIAETTVEEAMTIRPVEGDYSFEELTGIEVIDGSAVSVRDSGGPDTTPRIALDGVSDYLNLPETRVRYTFTVGVPWRSDGTEDRSRETTLTTPTPLSREVFRATNALLHELGVGLEAGASDQEEIDGDYDSILDEL